MKKKFYALSFLILILNSYTNGMTTQIRRPVGKPIRQTYIPRTKTYSKPYTKPTVRIKLQQYYTQFKQWLWGPSKNPQMIIAQQNKLINNVQATEPNSAKNLVEDFHIFLSTHNQDEVNIYLNNAITTKEGLYLLNEYIPRRLVETNRNTRKILEKIINWAKDDMLIIFKEDITIAHNFFLIQLTASLPDQFVPILIRNYDFINKKPRGKQFFELLKKDRPDIYKHIVEQHNLYRE